MIWVWKKSKKAAVAAEIEEAAELNRKAMQRLLAKMAEKKTS